MVHISAGNTKLGKVSNISLPPMVTCRKPAPCVKQCYAKKAFRLYPSVRRNWQENWDLYQQNPDRYFNEIREWLRLHLPTHFRWHVSGDVPDRDYFWEMYDIAEEFPEIRFMLFTKRWDFLPDRFIPDNLSIILSMWPGLGNPRKLKLPRAWLSHDDRKPKYYFKCPGKCDRCYKCWELVRIGYDVVFDLH